MKNQRADRPEAVTLNDVAAAAQVSRATASRVLLGDARVGPTYRSAVLAAAEQLGYVPNRAARSLRTRRSGSVGVVLAEPSAVVFGNPFFGHLLAGIAAQLNERDLQLTLFLPQNERDEKRLAAYLASGHVDGVLLTFYQDRDPLYDRLARDGIPVVVNARPLRASSASYVDADNEGGAALAVEHLIEEGCRAIATIAPLGTSAGAERLAGYRRALERAGRPVEDSLILVGDFTTPSGRELTAALLRDRPDVDGLFVAGELMAYGAMDTLHRLGRRIPEDIAIVSFDDLPGGASNTDPPLTSIRQPVEQMGREMTRLLLDQLDDADRVPRQVILGTDLVVRQSSRRRQPGDQSPPSSP